jgi:L-fucose isomerase-like protein
MTLTFGLIVGNRNFFPDTLAQVGREKTLKILEKEGYNVICLSPEDTKFGTIETWEDAKKCAQLFKENSDKIDGVIITLPNFGDEKGVANTLRLSGLKVPVLVHAFPDDINALDLAHRGDSFCGKISVCNNLVQYNIPFSLTRVHTINPEDSSFIEDLQWFSGVCKVVKGLKNIKVGAIGARPGTFNTVRFSEKILERYGISVEVIDLSEIFYRMKRLSIEDHIVKEKVEEIRSYCDTSQVPVEKIQNMAQLSITIENWMRENDIVASAIQCWTSIEYNLGIMPCSIMSMMSDKLYPSACEVDITGVLAMYALQCASDNPSALVDWNNNYDGELDKVILFHCGNFPKSIFESFVMKYGDVIGGTVGNENAYGGCAGNIKPDPFTFARLTTDDTQGKLKAYVGEGEITKDKINTYGAWGVAYIPKLQELLHFICKNGYEHHVAINRSQVARVLHEAFSNYLGIDVYWNT